MNFPVDEERCSIQPACKPDEAECEDNFLYSNQSNVSEMQYESKTSVHAGRGERQNCSGDEERLEWIWRSHEELDICPGSLCKPQPKWVKARQTNQLPGQTARVPKGELLLACVKLACSKLLRERGSFQQTSSARSPRLGRRITGITALI